MIQNLSLTALLYPGRPAVCPYGKLNKSMKYEQQTEKDHLRQTLTSPVWGENTLDKAWLYPCSVINCDVLM